MNKTGGFTLIEILIVMALIMILSVVGIASFMQSIAKSRDSQRKNNLQEISKALESFYTDVGRYPISTDTEKFIHCYEKTAGVVKNTSCVSSRLLSFIEGVTSQTYITIPSDPDPSKKYIYISPTGSSYSLYTALENKADKDLIKDDNGDVVSYSESCGAVSCNYQVTDTGLVKEL